MQISIVTTAHWDGDPRLNRHKAYLERAGHRVAIVSFHHQARGRAIWSGCRAIVRSPVDLVILTDPEMFLIGSLLARLWGRIPVVDIHEDYARVAAGRSWAPRYLRRAIGALARMAVFLGRHAATKVMVAAPQLARPGDVVVLNLPDPAEMSAQTSETSRRLVYVGDVTLARGAVDMVEVLGHLDDDYELVVIGNADEGTLEAMKAAADTSGVTTRLHFAGRLDHATAWSMAAGSVVGLNLLHDLPAYRDAIATKLWEYMASGIPPIVSDLPGQRSLVSRLSEELVCGSAEEAAVSIRGLADDRDKWLELVVGGRRLVEEAWAENRPDLAVQSLVEP